MNEVERTRKWGRRFLELSEQMHDPLPEGFDPVRWEGARIACDRMAEELAECAMRQEAKATAP